MRHLRIHTVENGWIVREDRGAAMEPFDDGRAVLETRSWVFNDPEELAQFIRNWAHDIKTASSPVVVGED